MAANSEVALITESLLKWKSNKAGATAITLGLVRAVRIQVDRNYQDVEKTDGEFDHAKKLQDPRVSTSFTINYRDHANAYLGSAANGFAEKDATKSVPDGTLYIETLQPDGTYDKSQVDKATLMAFTRRSTGEIEYSLESYGEPVLANGVATTAGAVGTSGNPEIIVQPETYVKWKTDSAVGTPAPSAQTLGFVSGGWDYSVQFNRVPVFNNNGTFSHWKEPRKPRYTVNVNKLYQDFTSELLMPHTATGTAPATSGFNQLKAGQTVPTGTLSVEGRHADGSTLDVTQFPKGKLASWGRTLGDPDTLTLTFNGIGSPSFGSVTLS